MNAFLGGYESALSGSHVSHRFRRSGSMLSRRNGTSNHRSRSVPGASGSNALSETTKTHLLGTTVASTSAISPGANSSWTYSPRSTSSCAYRRIVIAIASV